MSAEQSPVVLRLIEAQGAFGRVHLLADQDGLPIHGQTAVSIQHAVDAMSTITVTFQVDGKYIRIGSD